MLNPDQGLGMEILMSLLQFLIPWARVGTLPAQAENVAAQDALYDWLETETAAY